MVATVQSSSRLSSRAQKPGQRLRVAVVGCGAIAQKMHLPVLAGHEGIELAALVDRDAPRAKKLAQAYGIKQVLTNAGELDAAAIDAAIVATPPCYHAPCAIELMRRGIHVLVEKPMAINLAEAEAMVETAEEREVVLSVGFYRRLFPSMRLLKSLLDSAWLGRPVRFHVEGGGMRGWGATTLGNMSRDLAGGGVLIDFGSHMLDLLFYLFDEPAEIIDYRDNALGGIEADCSIKLRLNYQDEPIEGTVELARTRNLGNRIEVDCERGRLVFQVADPYRVWITPFDLVLRDPQGDGSDVFAMQASWADVKESPAWGYDLFRVEIDDWLDAIRTGTAPRLSARSALATVRLIEECYRRPRPLLEPWVKTWTGAGSGQDNEITIRRVEAGAQESNGALAALAKKRRVLITGATGFIGSRLAEILHLRDGWDVRALVHNPGNASRLARLPIEMVQGDLGSGQEVRRLVEACDAVVHCAIGTSYGQRREIFAVTVDGTRRLAEAARAAGVRRFVHLSSIAVHGNDVTGTIDEETPLRPTSGEDYSQSKAEAERVIARAVARGLSAVVLRPGCVYGPFSTTFIVRPIEYLIKGQLLLEGSADTPSNTVYVDNLVQAIVCALEVPAEAARGQVFTIGEGDDLTWGEFYGYFARELGLKLRTSGPAEAGRRGGGWRSPNPLRWLRSWSRSCASLLTSPELRSLGRRFLETDPLGTFPRWLLQRCPGLERGLRRLVKAGTAEVYVRSQAGAEDLLRIRPRRARIGIDKARRVLGYEPAVDRARALALTLDWLRHARLA